MRQTTLDQMFAKSARATRSNPKDELSLVPAKIQQVKEAQKSQQKINNSVIGKPPKRLHHNTIKAMQRKKREEEQQKQQQKNGIEKQEDQQDQPQRQRSRKKKGRPPKVKRAIVQKQSQNNDQKISDKNQPEQEQKLVYVQVVQIKQPRRFGRPPKNKVQPIMQEEDTKKINEQIQNLQIQPIQIRIELNSQKPIKNKKSSITSKGKPMQEKVKQQDKQVIQMEEQVNEKEQKNIQPKKRQVKKVIKKGLKIQQKSQFTLYNKYFSSLIDVDRTQKITNQVLDKPLIFDKFRHTNQYQQLICAIHQK